MKFHKSSASGVALIIVLGFLVIITALAVAFFSSVTTELKASRNFASGVSTQQLAESAVQVVIGQISDATTKGISPSTGQGTEAWATQPGLIRVFDASGNPDTYYLLYSSDDMVKTASGTLATYDPTADYSKVWDQNPAIWTDLNSPVMVWNAADQATEPRFPIIDPRAFSDSTLTSDTPAPTQQYNSAWANNKIEGFWYDASSGVDGILGPGNPNKQRLPMPVKWIYVLQDGTLTAPTTASAGATASLDYGSGDPRTPTQLNPVVGRMAFWTDDDTSKLNVNTAAGFINSTAQLPSGYPDASHYAGSFWDTPRFYTSFDYGNPYPAPPNTAPLAGTPQPGGGGLALCQLLQNEFQRYPGHPATTSLAPVFSNLLTSDQLYGITPRYSNIDMTNQPGGTSGGTRRIIVDNSAAVPPTVGADGNANTKDNREIQPKQDRLYASVDELLWGAHAGGLNNGSITASSPNYARLLNNNYTQPAATTITPQELDLLRFFLTTQSRAPELNLYGQPRVTAWPVRAENATETSGMNVFDNLILFCSTVGVNSNPSANGRPDTSDTALGTDSTTNGQFRYMFTRREVDQTTGTPLTISSPATQDCEFPRNKYLLGTYLYNFLSNTNVNIPGFGATWSAKFGSSDQQSVLMEMFDYVRCANSQDTTTSLSSGKAIEFAPQGVIMPSVPQTYFNGVKGAGRMSTLYEATIDFYYAGPVMAPASATTLPESSSITITNSGWSKWDPKDPLCKYAMEYAVPNTSPAKYMPQRQMRAFLVFSTFDPMQGYAPKSDPVVAGYNPNNSPLSVPASPKMTIEANWAQDPTVSFVGIGPNYLPNTAPPSPQYMYFYNSPEAGEIGNATASTTVNRSAGAYWGGRNFGGYEGFMHTLMGAGSNTGALSGKEKIAWGPGSVGNIVALDPVNDVGTTNYYTTGTTWSPTPLVNAFAPGVATNNQEFYPFQTDSAHPMIVPIGATGFTFSGGTLTVNLKYAGVLMQTFKLQFPGTTNTAGWPIPAGDPPYFNPLQNGKIVATSADVTTWDQTTDADKLGSTPSGTTQGAVAGMGQWYWGTAFGAAGYGGFFQNNIGANNTGKQNFKYRTSLQAAWSFSTRLAWCLGVNQYPATPSSPALGGGGDENGNSNNSSNIANTTTALEWGGDRWHCLVQPGDTVRSLLYWDGNSNTGGPLSNISPIISGDLRVGQLTPSVAITSFMPHPDYQKVQSRACMLRGGDGGMYFPNGSTPAVALASGTNMALEPTLGNHVYLGTGTAKVAAGNAFGNLPWGGGPAATAKGTNGVLRSSDQMAGDWDNGAGNFPDGPFLNKQDEGNVIYRYYDTILQMYIYPIPYFTSTYSYQKPGDSFTSPSRQMPSPVMFGSLPAHVFGGGPVATGPHHWETLCFCPNPAGMGHPGNKLPKDHLLLDLFQMPVVEPYPISEPFSTAGKVNLNYRIAPFDYIRRSTALRGALHSVRVTAVNSQYTEASTLNPNYLVYKTGNPAGTPLPQNFRLLVDRDQTIAEMDAVYNTQGGFFKSASQICEMYLIPWNGQSTTKMSTSAHASDTAPSSLGSNMTTMQTWWASPWDVKSAAGNGDLTGDNEREKPYADLYPRVTTKSNTFTVHMRVQSLRQLPRLAKSGQNLYTTWNEGKDAVLAEYRGSSTIERYLDPADPRIGTSNYNGAPQTNPDTQSMEKLYHFRTVINKKFSP